VEIVGLRPNEISALIKEQIKHYDDIIEQKDVATNSIAFVIFLVDSTDLIRRLISCIDPGIS
jgi:hypothetical protein